MTQNFFFRRLTATLFDSVTRQSHKTDIARRNLLSFMIKDTSQSEQIAIKTTLFKMTFTSIMINEGRTVGIKY